MLDQNKRELAASHESRHNPNKDIDCIFQKTIKDGEKWNFIILLSKGYGLKA